MFLTPTVWVFFWKCRESLRFDNHKVHSISRSLPLTRLKRCAAHVPRSASSSGASKAALLMSFVFKYGVYSRAACNNKCGYDDTSNFGSTSPFLLLASFPGPSAWSVAVGTAVQTKYCTIPARSGISDHLVNTPDLVDGQRGIFVQSIEKKKLRRGQSATAARSDWVRAAFFTPPQTGKIQPARQQSSSGKGVLCEPGNKVGFVEVPCLTAH